MTDHGPICGRPAQALCARNEPRPFLGVLRLRGAAACGAVTLPLHYRHVTCGVLRLRGAAACGAADGGG